MISSQLLQILSSQPTYEGLKQGKNHVEPEIWLRGSQPTYEGLKLDQDTNDVVIVDRSQPTYEGLKPCHA